MLENYMPMPIPKNQTPDPKLSSELKKLKSSSYFKRKAEYNKQMTEITRQIRESLKQEIKKIDTSSITIELDSRANFILESIYQKIKELNVDWFILIVGSEGIGKMLSEDIEVLLSNGEWKKAGDIRKGDKILSPQPDGSYRIARITRNDKMFMPDAYDVVELNNQHRKLYTCCGNHEIPLNIKNKKKEWIIKHYLAKDICKRPYNFLKDTTHILMPPVEKFEGREDPDVDPYILGVYLGDGYSKPNPLIHKIPSHVTDSFSKDICEEKTDKRKPYMKIFSFKKDSRLSQYLEKEGLRDKKSGEKFIPKSALLSSISFRRKLLAGLIDTDGYYNNKSHYEITTKSSQMARDIQFLVHTLGGRCRINETWKRCPTFKENEKRKYYRISIYLGRYIEDIPLLNEKKKKRDQNYFYLSPNRTSIKLMPQKGRMMCTCTVDKAESPSQWLVVRDSSSGVCSVTHNSSCALNIFAKFCQLSNYDVAETLLRTLIYDEDELLRFISTINPDEKYLPILLDEGANILFNRESMSVKRNYILKFFNVMRFLNSVTIICSPNVKFIDKNVKTHRVKSIFYIQQRGVYWYYDKQQIDHMVKNETPRSWKWIEPKYVGTYSVNQTLENITTLIKKSYVKMFSEKINLFLQTQDSQPKLT